MKKILLVFDGMENQEEIDAYLKETFALPNHYDRTTDALYDRLAETEEPTAIGFYMPFPEDEDDFNIDVLLYLEEVRGVLIEAEEENENIAVIFGDLFDNFSSEDYEEDETDRELEKLLAKNLGLDADSLDFPDTETEDDEADEAWRNGGAPEASAYAKAYDPEAQFDGNSDEDGGADWFFGKRYRKP